MYLGWASFQEKSQKQQVFHSRIEAPGNNHESGKRLAWTHPAVETSIQLDRRAYRLHLRGEYDDPKSIRNF